MAQDKKQKWISNKIAILRREGYSADQASAIAYSMWADRKKENGGKQLPKYQNGRFQGMSSFLNRYFGNQSQQTTLNPQTNTPKYQSPFFNGLPEPIDPNFIGPLPPPPIVEPQPPMYPQPQGHYNFTNNFGMPIPQAPQTQQVPTIQISDEERGIQQRQPVQAVSSLSLSGVNVPSNEQQLQQSAQGVLDSGELERYQAQKESNGNQYRIPQPPNYQIFNPYGGVDIPTAAAYLGTSIESGNTLGAIASGLKVATGVARNAFGAAGRQRRNEYLRQEYEDNVRDYLSGANNPTYLEEGGSYKNMKLPPAPPKLTPYQNGGEKIDQEKLMTGEFITGASPNNTAVEPNSEVETEEYILTPQGESMKVLGKTHEQGGEDVELQEGDMVISDNLQLKGENAKKLRKKYDIKVKAKNTYAEAVDKIYNKIGLSKLIKEEEKVLERIKKETEETKDGNTQSLNLQFLYGERDKILQKKQELEPKRLQALKEVFVMQEESKPKEEAPDINPVAMYQDGGQKLSPYAYIMFEGTPEQQAFVQADMSRYFDPEGEFYEANHRQESAEEHLARMRPIYEEMKKSGTLNEYVEQNDPFLSNAEFIEESTVKEIADKYGLTSSRAQEVLDTFKKGGYKKYQNGEEVFFIENAPQQSLNEEGFYGGVGQEQYQNFITNNSWWYDFSGFDPNDPIKVKDFQEAFNKMGGDVLVDGKFGIQTASIVAIPKVKQRGSANDIEVELIQGPIDAKTTTEGEKEKPEAKGTVTEEDTEGVSLNIPLLPNQSILPPSGQASQLMVNRRYDRLTPYEVSPEQIIQENQRQAQAAYQSVQGLPDSQRAAAIAQINANTQAANARAIAQTEAQNAAIANQTAAQNAQIQMREEDMAASDALSYEQRQQTAAAITEEQIQQYYDFMRRANVSKFNDIRRMNTINQIFDNYNIDSLGNINVEGAEQDQANWIAQARALGYQITPPPTTNNN